MAEASPKTLQDIQATVVAANQELAVYEDAYVDRVIARLAAPDVDHLLAEITELAGIDCPAGPIKEQLGHVITILTQVPITMAGRKQELQGVLPTKTESIPPLVPKVDVKAE